MKRSFSQPLTSGESGKRSRLFSLQQALDLVYDSDEDEQDLADIYPESDLESVDSDVNSESSNEDKGLDVDLDLSSPAPRPTTAQVGRGTGRNRSRPTAGGDADNLSTGWTRAFFQQNLRVEFDSRGVWPQNCPPNITEMSSQELRCRVFCSGAQVQGIFRPRRSGFKGLWWFHWVKRTSHQSHVATLPPQIIWLGGGVSW